MRLNFGEGLEEQYFLEGSEDAIWDRAKCISRSIDSSSTLVILLVTVTS